MMDRGDRALRPAGAAARRGGRGPRRGGLRAWSLVLLVGLAGGTSLAAVAASPARASEASDAQRAEEWYQVAMAHMKGKRYLKAAKAFEKAHEFDPNPVLLWNIGRANEKAGELDRAKGFYTDFLKSEGIPGELRVKASKRIVAVSVALEKARMKAEQAVKEAKLKAEMEAKLKAERDRAAKERAAAEARAQAELAQEMAVREEAKRQAAAEAKRKAEAARVKAEAKRKAEAAAAAALRAKALAPGPSHAVTTTGWVLLGAGVALAGAGGGLLGHAGALRGDVRDAKAAGDPATGMTRAQALANEDDADLQATLGVVGLAVGGAALTTGVVLLLVGDAPPPRTQVSADVARGGFVLRVGGTY